MKKKQLKKELREMTEKAREWRAAAMGIHSRYAKTVSELQAYRNGLLMLESECQSWPPVKAKRLPEVLRHYLPEWEKEE